nr:reverse transcriptase domain-containing protein [Tanacetum cinerariifolium]
MREFVVVQKAANDFVKNQFYDLKTKVKQGQENHQAAIQDLEIKFGRNSDHQSSRPTGTLPSNTQTNPKPSTLNDKPYRPPPAQNEEKIKARYAKFLDMIKEVMINVPLVDVLAGMPNYGKFLKDLVSNKSKTEQILVAFLTEECSAIIQNKLPSKLRVTGSFLIPCKLTELVEYLTLADLGAIINLMQYLLYAALSGKTLEPTRMIGKFVFPVDFVILKMEEDDRVPLILGRPLLHTTDAIIRLKKKEPSLGIGEDRATFLINKAMQHSHLSNDTCFCMDVIDGVTEDEINALLDDSKPLLSTSEKISETPLDKEFEEFMTGDVQEDEVKDDFEELPPKDELRIKTSIQDPPTDL